MAEAMRGSGRVGRMAGRRMSGATLGDRQSLDAERFLVAIRRVCRSGTFDSLADIQEEGGAVSQIMKDISSTTEDIAYS